MRLARNNEAQNDVEIAHIQENPLKCQITDASFEETITPVKFLIVMPW
jgi:hypothetical protein